jgi:hypothetical protein
MVPLLRCQLTTRLLKITITLRCREFPASVRPRVSCGELFKRSWESHRLSRLNVSLRYDATDRSTMAARRVKFSLQGLALSDIRGSTQLP